MEVLADVLGQVVGMCEGMFLGCEVLCVSQKIR